MRASLIILLFSTYSIFSQNILTDTVFHKVERKETLFSISEKYKIKINDLLNLNPQLRESKLRRNSTILIPVYKIQELEVIVNEDIKNTEQDEMVELEITSLDSIYIQKKKRNNKLNISVLLPFRSSNLNFNSIKEVESLLVDRNLYTIALDLYSGILHAINDLKKMGISINLNVFDTDNSLNKILEISNSEKIRNSDLIIGPLLPRNFETFSAIDFLEGIPKVFPLSNIPIKILKGVIQTVTPRNLLREKMIEYLDINIDRDENIVIIADSLNLDIKNKLTSIFPNSIKIKPEFEGYVLPELLDSLLVDSLPNKVIVESEIFTLVSSIVSQLNSQITPERDVRLYTTYKGNQYDDPSIDIKNLGDLRFTYPSISKKIRSDSITDFKENYKDLFGSLPNSDVVRGYDITKDIVLRILLDNNINKTVKYGEQSYNESKFLYKKDTLGGLFNSSIYILKHFDYDIEEINQ
ncbi:MAG: LysM domain-containing protein [Bacteroidota bacterium]|nr:LysM domain-containing protein [Bacteroidota bacterium]|tara:strand:+ start:87 stop:1490 length:1404 start_codon:yes stop_codon:yes gene_type:complete